jgi:hypothetical protein
VDGRLGIGKGESVSDISDEQVEKLAQKLLRGGDPAAPDLEAARRSARRMLEDSEERTFDPAAHDHEAEGVIRRSSGETAATGETGHRWTSEGE